MKKNCTTCGYENIITAKFCNNCGSELKKRFHTGKPLPEGTIIDNRYKIITAVKSYERGNLYRASDNKLEKLYSIREFFSPCEHIEATIPYDKEQINLLSVMEKPDT